MESVVDGVIELVLQRVNVVPVKVKLKAEGHALRADFTRNLVQCFVLDFCCNKKINESMNVEWS